MKKLKIGSGFLLFIIGLYVAFQGYSTYTFSARSYDGSMGVYKFGYFIPATDYHLHTTGVIFTCVGLVLIISTSYWMYLLLKKQKESLN
ncbi:hypothetical protein MHH56_19145 [Paenibacillus sp. FSL K6-3182]|uniref:hypothetical protein n=1 Tax=Paenibacillus sp. FSL K6-3182 TaxID=2921495 RepID=UPI0030CD01FE